MGVELATTKRALGAAKAQLKATKAQLAIQVADLQRLHHLGLRLSTHVELSTLLHEVLTAVCTLQDAPVGLLMVSDAISTPSPQWGCRPITSREWRGSRSGPGPAGSPCPRGGRS